MEKKQEECELCEDWLGTYGDMITLLMCFFVLLASASKVDIVLFEQIEAGLSKGLSDIDNPKPVEMMMVDLSDDIQSMELGEKVSLASDEKGIVLEMASASFFASGSASLKPEALLYLNGFAATLGAERYDIFRFVIEGHTDDAEIHTEKYPSNWELSAARASSVVRYFISRGLDPYRMRAVGLADTSPKEPNRDPFGEPIPSNREKNRRIVIRIEPTWKR
jgi:chemotaxis protein MotB